jgi:hypothetical protein
MGDMYIQWIPTDLNEQLVVVAEEWVLLVVVELTNTIWGNETLWFIKQRENWRWIGQWEALEQLPSSIVRSRMLPTHICVAVGEQLEVVS